MKYALQINHFRNDISPIIKKKKRNCWKNPHFCASCITLECLDRLLFIVIVSIFECVRENENPTPTVAIKCCYIRGNIFHRIIQYISRKILLKMDIKWMCQIKELNHKLTIAQSICVVLSTEACYGLRVQFLFSHLFYKIPPKLLTSSIHRNCQPRILWRNFSLISCVKHTRLSINNQFIWPLPPLSDAAKTHR